MSRKRKIHEVYDILREQEPEQRVQLECYSQCICYNNSPTDCFLCEDSYCAHNSFICCTCENYICVKCVTLCFKCENSICNECSKYNSCKICSISFCTKCELNLKENICSDCRVKKVFPFLFKERLSESTYKLDCLIKFT